MSTEVEQGAAPLDADAALAAGEARVGGKALGLAKLGRAGALVPWWVVLPVEAFERHLERAGLDSLVRERLAALTGESVERTGEELRAAVEAAPLDPELAAAIERAAEGREALAVRSSMVGEDSAEQSFAGLFDSHLFLRGAEEVQRAVTRCWGSAFTPRALAYQLRHGGEVRPPAMAVVIQEMVCGEVSGVLFTRNPVSGREDEALASACWGLGEGIVNGVCNTDELVWSHAGRELSVTVADKDVQVVPDEAGGTREAPVPENMRTARALDAAALDELGRRGLELARALGSPQDIEWTRRRGELFFLQARPITARAPASPLGDRRIVWNNSNIQESFNGVTTPLTFSVAVRTYSSVYEQTMRVLGISEDELRRYQPVFRNMIGIVRGRIYYNINNWYRLLLLLPGFDRNAEDMERMMGLEEPVDFVEGVQVSAAEKLRRAPGMARVAARLANEFRRLEGSVERFLSQFAERTAHLDRDRLAKADLGELLHEAEYLRTEVFGDWATPIVNDIYVSNMSGKLRRLVEGVLGDEAPEVVNGLLSGEEAIESMEPTKRLMELGRDIRGDDALAAALNAGEPAEALAALREDPGMRSRLDDFMERYGDRCMGEMKIETLSLRQDPTFVVQVLRNFGSRADISPEALDARERERREEFERKVAGRLSPRQRKRLESVLVKARRGVKQRENMRFARTRLVGFYRDIYNAAGHRLHEAGLLDHPRDVFYLTAEELLAYHEGTAVTSDLRSLARVRKAEYAAYEGQEVPNHFETHGSPYHGAFVVPGATEAAADDGDGRVLRGTGCCPGVVEGELAIVMSPQDDLAVNGKILTTVRTDPGWTPLFPSAAALLIERGSTLSHSAVVAREFGIPAVVGVPGLLRKVRDGERVRLDGGTGVVERLDAE